MGPGGGGFTRMMVQDFFQKPSSFIVQFDAQGNDALDFAMAKFRREYFHKLPDAFHRRHAPPHIAERHFVLSAPLVERWVHDHPVHVGLRACGNGGPKVRPQFPCTQVAYCFNESKVLFD